MIKALFGGPSLNADYPGRGEACFARTSEVTHQSWDDVLDELVNLARNLGLQWRQETGEDSSIDHLLRIAFQPHEAKYRPLEEPSPT